MITGYFDPARAPHPYLTVAVQVPVITGTRWVGVPFLVDTGAGHTCVHPLDAVRRFGISPTTLVDPTKWPAVVNGGGVGGGAQYFDCPALYGFARDDGQVETIAGSVWFGQLTPGNQRIPSLLGWDMLQHFKLDVHGRAKTITLERV